MTDAGGALTEPPRARMGVNSNRSAADVLAGARVVEADGRNWDR